jgi:hypothetical protein
MNRTIHVVLSAMVALVSMLVALTPAEAQQKPNIILILSDDFGYGDSGPYGAAPAAAWPRQASTAWPTRA